MTTKQDLEVANMRINELIKDRDNLIHIVMLMEKDIKDIQKTLKHKAIFKQ